jgi:CTD small phosphatase-like protein 2
MDKTGMINSNLGAATPSLPVSPLANGEDPCPQTPDPTTKLSAIDREALSPMHPARPLARSEEEETTEIADGEGPSKLVDVIFSPMLKFLGGAEGEEEDATEGTELEEHVTNDDLDAKANGDVVVEEEEEEPPQINEEEEEQVHQDEPEDAIVVEADEETSQGSEVDEEEEFNPYAFIKSLPAYEEVKSFCPPDRLPAKDVDAPPISLVLDLDETLVHCTVEACDDADLTFPVEFHGMTYQVYVRLRPHLNEFLEAISDKFEVIVFTASQQVYADALLNLIDPENKYIKHRMFRESCLSVEGNFLKDLNVLGRDLKKSVLVDNSPHAFGYQVDNGIPIESWFDDRNDTELLKLERFLRTLHGVKDVRTVVRRSFQTYRLIANAP